MIMERLNNPLLEHVFINRKVITSNNSEILNALFTTAPNVYFLSFDGCIFHTEVVAQICDLIQKAPSIKILCLPNFSLQDSAKIMQAIGRTLILEDFLPRIKCTEETLPLFIDAFKKNKSIKKLSFSFDGSKSNEIKLHCLIEFLENVLPYNETLFHLRAPITIGEAANMDQIFINKLVKIILFKRNKFEFIIGKWKNQEMKNSLLNAIKINKQYRSFYWVWLIIKKGKFSKILITINSNISKNLIGFLGDKMDDDF